MSPSYVWSDAVLYVMMERGPKHKEIANLLFPLPQEQRIEIVKVARQVLPRAKGDWLDALRWVTAAAIAGADIYAFREIVNGRAWSLGSTRHSGITAEETGVSNPDR